ncbi:hypothetical protein BgiBS90_018561 [Biomphalaria glabrata]|nr:hypothetical protein BgiBS90_018561 [Biomphalaria glabrata]
MKHVKESCSGIITFSCLDVVAADTFLVARSDIWMLCSRRASIGFRTDVFCRALASSSRRRMKLLTTP